MKTQKTLKTLKLKKTSIANLNVTESSKIKGGLTYTDLRVCDEDTKTNYDTNCECTEFNSCTCDPPLNFQTECWISCSYPIGELCV